MSTPRGFNPVGESAPGLPRHDAPLPGHVPGQYAPMQDASSGNYYGSPNVAYRDPGFGPRFGKWSARIIMACAIWITLPLQLALYPIAAAVALPAGAMTYAILRGAGAGFDTAMSWSWNVAFAALVVMMRVETGIDDRHPRYRAVRHWLRLVFVCAGFYYFARDTSAPVHAVVEDLFVAAIAHFVLRAALIRGLWDSFQTAAWLRKA